jgi:hypothetical protein
MPPAAHSLPHGEGIRDRLHGRSKTFDLHVRGQCPTALNVGRWLYVRLGVMNGHRVAFAPRPVLRWSHRLLASRHARFTPKSRHQYDLAIIRLVLDQPTRRLLPPNKFHRNSNLQRYVGERS